MTTLWLVYNTLKKEKMIKEFEFEGLVYTASETGKIFGKNGIELKQRLDADGYPIVTLGNKKIRRSSVRVHRIICKLFILNPENKPEVNHIDGIKTNNNYTNLEWNTRSEQMLHAHKMGLKSNSGILNPKAKSSEPDVLEIRKLYNDGWKIYEIRNKFGRGWSTIYNIVIRNTWVNI
jgi:hypothetical protein